MLFFQGFWANILLFKDFLKIFLVYSHIIAEITDKCYYKNKVGMKKIYD